MLIRVYKTSSFVKQLAIASSLAMLFACGQGEDSEKELEAALEGAVLEQPASQPDQRGQSGSISQGPVKTPIDKKKKVETTPSENEAVTPQISISIDRSDAPEAESYSGVITLSRTNNILGSLPVGLEVVGNATIDSDFTLESSAVLFAAGESEKQINFAIIDDAQIEPNESFVVRLVSSSLYEVGEGAAVFTISDDDAYFPDGGKVFHLHAEMGHSFSDGAAVAVIGDQSANGIVVDQSSSSNQPLFSKPGPADLGAIQFDGVDDFLNIANHNDLNLASVYTHKTMAVVFKTGSDVSGRQIVYEQGGSSRGLNFYIENQTLYACGWNLPNDDGGATTPWLVSCLSRSVKAGTLYYARMNYDSDSGTIDGTLNMAGMGSIGGIGKLFAHSGQIALGTISNGTCFVDGSCGNGAYHFGGGLYEMIIYNEILSSDDSYALDLSMSSRYGLSQSIVNVSLAEGRISEGESTTLTVSRNQVSSQAIDVVLNLSGSVGAGDHSVLPAQVTIPAFETEVLLDISASEDGVEEMVENLVISIVSSENYDIGVGNVTLLIDDSDSYVPVPGLISWMDSSYLLTEVGGMISGWGDRNQSSISAYQNNGGNQPTLVVDSFGSRAGLQFDGVDDILLIDDHSAINLDPTYQEKTVSLVFRTSDDVNTRQVLYEQGGSSRGLNVYLFGGKVYVNIWNNYSDADGPWGPLYLSADVVNDINYYVTLTFNSASEVVVGYLNGVSIGQVTGAKRLFGHGGDIGIGGAPDSTYFENGPYTGSSRLNFKGQIGSLILYNRELNASELSELHGYLQSAYGFSL